MEAVSAAQIIFLVVALLTVLTAFLVVTVRNLIHAALWLVATLFGIAVIFVLLDAGFMATVQVVLYIGAIAILIVFAVMLTRRVMQDVGSQSNEKWWLGTIVAAVFFAAVSTLLWSTGWPALPGEVVGDTVLALGRSLVDPNQYVIPFELASVLLIIALIGSIALALPGKRSE